MLFRSGLPPDYTSAESETGLPPDSKSETGLPPDYTSAKSETGFPPDSKSETGLPPDYTSAESETGLPPDSDSETGSPPDSTLERGRVPLPAGSNTDDTDDRLSFAGKLENSRYRCPTCNNEFKRKAIRNAETKCPRKPSSNDGNNILLRNTCNAKQPTDFWIDTIAGIIGLYDVIARVQICDNQLRTRVSEGVGTLCTIIFYSLFISGKEWV